MMQLIHVTVAYSNAVLVAVLPHISAFAKKLDLPVPQPIMVQHVVRSKLLPYKGEVTMTLTLTNRYWFAFEDGYVRSFRAPDDYFCEMEITNDSRYVGQSHMTTNEVVEMARDTLRKLGYKPENMDADQAPESIQGPFDTQLGHIPFCQVRWDNSDKKQAGNRDIISIDINTQKKTVVGFFLLSPKATRSSPKLDVEPELETDFQKPGKSNVFIRTNALQSFP